MPLAGENFQPEPGPVRSDDLRKQREESERFQEHYDPRLNRELTPQEKANRDRVSAATEYWFKKYKQEQAEEAAEKTRRIADQKARRDRDELQARQQREAQERRARLAQFELVESLEDDMRERMGFEKPQITWRLG